MSSNSDHSPAQDEGYSPQDAFELRRQCYLRVQEAQRQEHDALNAIAKITEQGKRRLLCLISEWLLRQCTPSSDHWEAEELSGCAMREWLELQGEAPALEAEVVRRETIEKAAVAAYNAAAPWGLLTTAFAGEDGKSRIRQCSQEATDAQTVLAAARAQLQANVQRRQEFGRRFMRGCLANVDCISDWTVFGPQATAIIDGLRVPIEHTWREHLAAMQAATSDMNESLERLKRTYRLF